MKTNAMNVSRRHFLSGMGACAAVGLLSPSLLVSAKAQASADTTRLVLTGSHWGAIRAKVVNGRFVEAVPFELDAHPTKMINGLADHVYATSRVRYPMVRVDWLRNRHNSDTTQRGDNRFVRVSWDEALDLFYQELERVQTQYGPSALLTSSGWQSTGMLHNPGAMLSRAISLHGTSLSTGGDYSTGAAQVILPRVVGAMEVYEQQTSWPLVLKNSKTIVIWGSDPYKNLQVAWWCPDHDEYAYYAQLKEKVASGEIKVVSIDPTVSSTHDYLGRDKVQHIALNPQTDVPLQLAIAHTIYSENLHDKRFLNEFCVGFEQFLPYLLGATDGQPKDAEWAAKICGIDADVIRALAKQMSTDRTQIIAGWCVQRMQHGEQWAWMIVVIAAMLGQIGLPGGGFGFGWHYNGAGVPTRKGVILGGFSGATATPPIHNGDFKNYSSSIPIARFVDAMLSPGKSINWNGKAVTLPLIKMCVFAGTNPFHRHQQYNRMIEGWKTLETVITVDNHWNATCRFSDIVLPATTQFERNDIDQFGNHSNRGLISMKQVVTPQFESRNDFDIFRELCKRFDREAAFSEGLDEMGWIKRIYQEGVQQGKTKSITLPDFDTFWKEKEYVEFQGESLWVRHQSFREDPDLEPLGTPSGLIEIYSKTIAAFNYQDCQGHPMWFEKAERSHGGPSSDKFPLHLQSCHPDFRLHSQLCESETLRKLYGVDGREPLFISPKDAESRGIKNGDTVRVFNNRGQVLAGAVVSDRYKPGVIRLHEGAWYDPVSGGEHAGLCRYGNPNVLTLDIGSSELAQATSAHTALVQIERFNGDSIKVEAFNGPKEMIAQCEYVPKPAEK
ncbi:trimethylamine-N-oxide reductase TorA [Budvicia diplopodorum]|uniref:trimethylamine-N-oxide reductase TorA n=1 Tax=Budvicia diplopodorum TaxID=1119056 RepID=UPI00135C1F8B|nr:trimethylamine-N-oxide reductase TorA [Budvicia diplopodorum]